MKTSTFWLCRLILKLNRIPRYGRLYRLECIPTDPDTPMDRQWKRANGEWTWQRNGHWGLNILARLGLLWRWLDEEERRDNANPGPPR